MQLLETMKAALKRISRNESERKEPEHPDDPYALVGAPKRPRTPLRSSAATVPLHFEQPPE
jgi:hypothetical protein